MAGLSPENVSQALSGAINTVGMYQNAISSVYDKEYKRALTMQALANAKKLTEGDDLDKEFPVAIPGLGKVSHREWKSFPKEDQEYAIYVQMAKKLGDEDIMSKREYLMQEPTERESFLRAAMEDPNLMNAATELAKAGAMNLGEFTARQEASAEVGTKTAGKKYFSGDWKKDVDKVVDADATLDPYFGRPEYNREKRLRTAKEVEAQIVSRGGTIEGEPKMEGRTRVWTVKWPDGSTSEVKYAF